MRVIELPDDQARQLDGKAAAQGLTLDGWFAKMAAEPEVDLSPSENASAAAFDSRPISIVIAEIMKDVPAEELAQLPRDGASQVDHYVYGLPKRD